MPRVILYDAETGQPQNAQHVRGATDQKANIATVPWQEWLRGSVAKHLCDKTTHMAAMQLVLHSLHVRGRIEEAPINVSVDLNKNRRVVTASEDLPKGTLALPPCVPHTSRVYDKSTHPHRVPIVVIEKSAVADGRPDTRQREKGAFEPRRSVYYVHPEFKMPEESKEQLDDAVASGARAWEFKGDGLGMSDGHGTFSYYRNLGRERLLKFARRRASV